MSRNRSAVFILCIVSFIILCTNIGIARAVEHSGAKMMLFGIATVGDRRYGTNDISVSSDGTLRVGIGESDLNDSISGIGIFETKLAGEYEKYARELGSLLCSEKVTVQEIPSEIQYYVGCDNAEGEINKRGELRDFSRQTAVRILKLRDLLTGYGVDEGKKLAKLDVSVESVKRESDGFVVGVRFSNSGDHSIAFESPDKWDGRPGSPVPLYLSPILAVRGSSIGPEKSEFAIALGGQSLAEPNQFPDGGVNIAPHSAVTIHVRSSHLNRFAAGTYELNVIAYMSIQIVGMQAGSSRVDFHSDYKSPTRVTFDRDYPSTPREREQWERTQRASMSYRPVKLGQPFAESGLYRAVLANFTAHRSLQLVPFKAGDIATKDNVKMLTASASGTELNGPVQWLWEGSAPTPVKQYSFDITEGTEHVCKAGAVCPRSGRWLARVPLGRSAAASYRYDLAGIVTLRRGQTLPARDDGADWEWLGV